MKLITHNGDFQSVRFPPKFHPRFSSCLLSPPSLHMNVFGFQWWQYEELKYYQVCITCECWFFLSFTVPKCKTNKTFCSNLVLIFWYPLLPKEKLKLNYLPQFKKKKLLLCRGSLVWRRKNFWSSAMTHSGFACAGSCLWVSGCCGWVCWPEPLSSSSEPPSVPHPPPRLGKLF